MTESDTINALAALGLFLSAGAGALSGHVAARRSRDQSSQVLDGAAGTVEQAGTGAELARAPALELSVREVRRTDEYVEWIATVRAHPDIAD